MKGNKIKDGFILLLYSLFPIIIGPVIIQIGNTKYKCDPAREARRGILSVFIKNTKGIQTNPAREARRGIFWTFLLKCTKGIQTIPAREARRVFLGISIKTY